jgi:predicted nucleic acid-binding protein
MLDTNILIYLIKNKPESVMQEVTRWGTTTSCICPSSRGRNC